MKRFMHVLNGIALIAALFSMPAGADDAAPGTSVLPASQQAPATIPQALVNTDRQNVQMTLASAAAIDPLRGKSRMDYGDIPASQIVPADAPGRNGGNAGGKAAGGEAANSQETAGEIWMFLGAISIAFMIAWRRCRWASLRGGSAISTGQPSPHPPHPPQHQAASPIGLAAGHGHLPFGG